MTSRAETLKMSRSRIRIVSVGWKDDEEALATMILAAETAPAADD